MAAVAMATVAIVSGLGAAVGAEVHVVVEDVPDGTPGNPAAPTPESTTAIESDLASSDVDAFSVCIIDPAAFHLTVDGIDDSGAPRSMDTVVWLFDEAGFLVATNDDSPTMPTTRGSALIPGSASAAVPGVHTVAIGHFRSRPQDSTNDTIDAAGEGPLDHWFAGSGAAPGPFRAELVDGATGSAGCGEPEQGHAVRTGNGRCQPLGGESEHPNGQHGLDKAAERRRSEPC